MRKIQLVRKPRVSSRSSSASSVESLEGRVLFAIDVTIDAATRYQTIDGFGTALESWHASPYATAAWQDMYYQDLGSSILRIALEPTVAAGSDNNMATPITFGTDLAANIAMLNFNIGSMSAFKSVAIAGQTKTLDELKVVGSIWSPPHWMKSVQLDPWSGQSTGLMPYIAGNDQVRGSLNADPANLVQFGRYVATWVAAWEQATGVELYSVSIQNELAQATTYSSCVYTPALFVKAVKAVGDAFVQFGIDTKIQGPEHFSIGSVGEPWQAYQSMLYVNALRADPVALGYVDTYLTHNYGNGNDPTGRSPQLWSDLWNGRTGNPAWTGIKNDGKDFWMSEDSGEAATWDGAMRLAAKTQDALTLGNVSAWIYWQTTTAATTHGIYNLTAGTDGLAKADKYAAQRHFFRYVRPDAVRVSATPSDPNGVEVSAFIHDEDDTLTSVLVNTTTTSQVINLHLSNVSLGSFGTYVESQAGSFSFGKAAVTVSNGVATITLPARSIVTLQGDTASASIGGQVYVDADDNAAKGTGEAGFSNVRIYDDVDRDAVWDATEPSVVSDVSGNYNLVGLAAGTHRIRVVMPTGQRLTQPSAGYYDVTVVDGQIVTGRMFGLTSKARFNGTVFKDNDGSGTFNSGDGYLASARVFIDQNTDGIYQTTEPSRITDTWGYYSFTNITAGTYRVRVEPTGGYSVTTPAVGYRTVTVTATQVSTYQSFGTRVVGGPVAFSGTLYKDNDNNGAFGTGDTYVGATQVFLDLDLDGILDAGEPTRVTDQYGFYQFTGLTAGTYRVRPTAVAGFQIVAPAVGYYDLTLIGGDNLQSKNFRYRPI